MVHNKIKQGRIQYNRSSIQLALLLIFHLQTSLLFPHRTSQLSCRTCLLSSRFPPVKPPMCVSFPSVRHIPHFGHQLHPNPRCTPSTANQRRQAMTRGHTDSRPGLSASLGGVWKSRAAATMAQSSALNEEEARQILLGRAFPPVWLLPNPLITESTRSLAVHAHWWISKVLVFMS